MRNIPVLAALLTLPAGIVGCGRGNSAIPVTVIKGPGGGSTTTTTTTSTTYAGTYKTGVFSGNDSEGTLNLTVTSAGAVTGALTIGGVKLAGTVVSGQSTVSGNSGSIVFTGTNATFFPIAVALTFSTTNGVNSAYGTYTTAEGGSGECVVAP